MNYRAFLPAALAAFVVLGSALPATAAEYAPRRAPLAAAAQTDQARVVVKFRADAPSLRAQALASSERTQSLMLIPLALAALRIIELSSLEM